MYACWKYVAIYALSLLGIGSALPAVAQITPDETLGAERSRVTRNVGVRGQDADRIDGGAGRGANLFHSFSEFNVNEGQRVYFANPTGVENILSRVTGRDVSDIMGTLGVDGGANLFLLNPNGIIFGPNARLDVSGSFTASTANSLIFPDGGQFSATNPQDSSLLSVTVPLGVQYGPSPTGAVTNAGLLSVGQNLTLSSGSVTSTGQLAAPFGQLLVEGRAGDVQVGAATAQAATFSASNNLLLPESQLLTTGDLNLLAGNTVWIRDSVVNPFVAQAGGNLTIQGNQGIDIFALNHPASGLVSGGDMVLRSANTVGGDAHYWTGGNFRIERLDGSLGNLFSPYDPVIRSSGDVTFRSYRGASLHIFAGGSVTAGDITITGVDLSNGFSEAVVELPDPLGDPNRNIRVSIDGRVLPTLDIRAGITDPSVDLTLPFTPPEPRFPGSGSTIIPDPPLLTTRSVPTIRISSITNRGGGQILLTNQYRSAGSAPASIEITGVIPDQGSLEAPDDLGNQSVSAYGGQVTIVASGGVRIANGVISGSGDGQGGNIEIYSGDGVTTESLQSQSDINDGGKITLRSVNNVVSNDIFSTSTNGFGGDIEITSENGIVRTGTITSEANTNNLNRRNGDIAINAGRNVTTGDVSSRVTGQAGFSGRITIFSQAGGINSGTVESSSPSQAGASSNFRNSSITITANGGGITTNAVRSFVGTYNNNQDVSTGGAGNSGNITLRARDSITVNGRIASFTGTGNAGNIRLRAGGTIDIISARSFVGDYDGIIGTARSGEAGDISLISRNGDIRVDREPGDMLAFSIDNSGSGFSEITLNARRGSVFLDGAELNTTNRGSSFAGDINVSAGNNIQIDSSALKSEGFFGQIFITASGNEVVIRNSTLSTNKVENNLAALNPQNDQAGLIRIRGEHIDIENSGITASIEADSGRGGLVEIDVLGTLLRLVNNSEIPEDNPPISARAFGGANGGNVEINAENGFVLANPRANTDIIARAEGGTGGRIDITTNAIFGLEERDSPTRLSDILADSEFGRNGEVVLDTLGIDPSRNPSELPLETVDAASLVVEGCLGPNRSGVEDQGEFVQSGRGGLSSKPTDPLSGETTTPPLATLNNEQTQSSDSIPPDVTVQRLVEAQKLRQDANGKVSLVAERSTVPPITPVSPPNICP